MSTLPSFVSRDRVVDAVLVVFCGIVQAIALAVAAFAMRDAFAALHSGATASIQTLVTLVGAGVMMAVCMYFAHRRSEALGQSYANALRRALYAHLAGMPKSLHSERRLGALSLRFVGDLSAARLWFGKGLPRVLAAVVILPGAACILFALNPHLAIAGIGPVVLGLALVFAVARHLYDRHLILRTGRASLSIAMIERVAISPELDLMGRTKRELRQLDERGAALRKVAVSRASGTGGLQAILQGSVAMAGVVVLWSAGMNGVTPGTTAAALSVLALLAMPLRDLALAWDQFCGWRVARLKALRLFEGKSLHRGIAPRGRAVSVAIDGQIDGHNIKLRIPAGAVRRLDGPVAARLAQAVTGLDQYAQLQVRYDDDPRLPLSIFVGDMHVGLQGSLRRTSTLMCTRRPSDRRISRTLDDFGLGPLMRRLGGLDARVGEGARRLTPAETLRLDLVRAVLGKAELIVIDSLRWRDDPLTVHLTALIGKHAGATLLTVEAADVTAGPDQFEPRPA